MLNGYIRYCNHIRGFNPVIALSGNGFAEAIAAFGSSRNYSKDSGGCCKEVVQSRGKKMEPWPKSDPPPPAWRPECPHEPQPPNYDPYRIKVPDIVVPPLPPSNAKETQSGDPKDMLKSSRMDFGDALNPMLDLFIKSPIKHPDYWKETKKLPSATDDLQEPLPRLGYHGKSKYKYAFHEPWKPLDRLTLLSQAEKEELEGQCEELSHPEVPVPEKC